MNETVECAAVKYRSVVYALERPYRHCNVMAFCRNEMGVDHYMDTKDGFLTSRGRFLNRDEAEDLARSCRQLTGDIIGGVLTSEDLW
ncbi:MAG: hypothetical protein JRC86_04795 [Deltaproteobacteria bacterium]|nr:hypothetical protein [Deltaproteobacteria bacterium]